MNRLFPEQLTHSLERKLAALYFLVGEDPLLIEESLYAIQQAALKQGFDEKWVLEINPSTDWNALFERMQSMGLFFNKQLIILDLPENLTALLQKNLLEFVSSLHPDVLPIFRLAKLTKAAEKQTWFIAANQYAPEAVLVNCQTPNVEQLPRWVTNRAKSLGLSIDEEAVQLLCYSYENNLLALKQALQLLDLLYADRKLSFARVNAVVEQSSVFTPFQWVDAILAGKGNRARRILAGLKDEDVQPIILLRTLQRDLMTLLELSKPEQPTKLDEPLPTAQLREHFDRLKVWQNRRPLFSQIIQRLTYRKLYLFFQELADVECCAKQEFSDDIWQQLEALTIEFCATS
ncbi:DNA polymerase III subunit delta [Aggregatibacter kilianii]|uniref:DNA polymerase III subunit delta n=1 Tax=Aggregatibacter kilianii TaxID=2025884 RepID=UPI000D6474A1|nr:DNA polymerase III subunit delta [Aggregatibacter kilianii]